MIPTIYMFGRGGGRLSSVDPPNKKGKKSGKMRNDKKTDWGHLVNGKHTPPPKKCKEKKKLNKKTLLLLMSLEGGEGKKKKKS